MTIKIAQSCLFTLVIVLSACTSITKQDTRERDGGPAVPVDVSHIPSATPQPVVRTIAGNKSPYFVFGKRYTVLADSHGFRQQGDASWYGTKFHGERTSNGEVYDMYAMTAAHKTLPIPSYVRVTNLNNRRSVIVRINDRGPFYDDRIIDLSYAAAKKLGYIKRGVAPVVVEDVTPKAHNKRIALEGEGADPAPATNNHASTAKKHSPLPASAPAYVQVGAFRQRQMAERLHSQLTAIVDYPVAIAYHNAWYRVRIGPVYTAESIAYLHRDLARLGHAKPLIVYE